MLENNFNYKIFPDRIIGSTLGLGPGYSGSNPFRGA